MHGDAATWALLRMQHQDAVGVIVLMLLGLQHEMPAWPSPFAL